MSFEFKLPDIGEGVVEGEIVSWLVKEGDTVTEDQPIIEVLTDKATVTIPSPKAGKVAKLPYKEGDVVPVGDVLIVLETAEDDSVPSPSSAPKSDAPAPTPVATAPVAKRETAAPTPQAMTERPTLPAVPATAAASTHTTTPTSRVLATPATRRLAREMGIAIQHISGTGKGGRVTKDDLRSAAGSDAAPAATPTSAPAAAPAAAPPAGPTRYEAPAVPNRREERTLLKGLRKIIAQNMVQSAFTAPHFTYVEEVDATELVALRTRLRSPAQARGTDMSYLPIIMKAVAIMLREHPILNASLDDATQEIIKKFYYNLGIAVATDRGLVVPVVKDVDQKGLLQISQELTDVSARARAMRMSPDDISGSTFTITSLGKLGGILATPILNPGEVAILGVHRMIERAVFVDGQAVPRQLMNLSLSFDHRVVDGYDGACAVQRLKELLENPDLLLLEMR